MKIKEVFKKYPENEPKYNGAVSFSVFDKVYMDSPFGRYTGIVKEVKDGKMTIESHSPTGSGTMWADYDIESTEWQKYWS